jgi:hypothetical protein
VTLRPRSPPEEVARQSAIVSGMTGVIVELFKLYHEPTLDAFG